MQKKNFSILIIMIIGICMILRSFFGGEPNSSENNDIPQYTTSGFVEELTHTGNDILNTGNTEIEIADEDTNDYTEIRVMMPKYFYNNGWKKFAENLYNDKKVYMKYIFIDDLNQYRNSLYNKDFSDADLLLFPYDRHDKISTRSFSAEQNIQPYFDPLLHSIIKDNQTTFLPFSADPMIMYTHSGYTGPNNFYEISEYVLNREPIRALSFPLFFGIMSEDSEDIGFNREYQDILRYALIHYFKTNNDSHDLQIRIDSNILGQYNISNLKTISNNIITTPECKYFPSICLQINNFVGIRFGFLSDYDIVNQYLHNKKSDFSNIKKFTIPFFELESPVRIRGRGMPSSLQDPEIINGVYAFLIKYMNDYSQYNLRNSTLPVFKTNDGGNGLLDNEYIGFRGYILQSGGDYISTLKGINKFRELIEYKITAEEFLR